MERRKLIEITSETMATDVSRAARLLRDEEIEAVNGGVTDGCIRLPTIIPFQPRPTEPFRDVFAKYTIG